MGSLVSWQCLDELFFLLLETSDHLDYQIFFFYMPEFVLGEHMYFFKKKTLFSMTTIVGILHRPKGITMS